MAVVDNYLAIAITLVPLEARLKLATDIWAHVLHHHLSGDLVLVNYHLELLLIRVNSLIKLLVLRNLLGNHLYLVNLRHNEAILLLGLLLLLVLHHLQQLLLS